MGTKILKVQKSNRSIWETKLSIKGHISDETSPDEQSYEMRIDMYDIENGTEALLSTSLPYKTIIVDSAHYSNNISKYGMEALLKGIEITSLLNVTEEPGNNSIDHYQREIESIAYSIVAKMEQDTFFNNYNPNNLRDYIEGKLLQLRDKFNIEPK